MSKYETFAAPTVRVLAAVLALLLPLGLPILAAEDEADPEALESFRGDLAQCVERFDALPTPLLEQVYDDPAVLNEALRKIAELSPEQLSALRDALREIPYWHTLPSVLETEGEEEAGGFDFDAALDAMTPSSDPDEFRDRWMGFFDGLEEIPEETAGGEFFDRVNGVKARMAELSRDELVQLEAMMKERVPRWREALRQRAERDARYRGVDLIGRSVPAGLEHLLPSNGDDDPFEGVPQQFANPTFVDDPLRLAAMGCGSGLNGVLCEIGEIFDAIVAFPGQVANFATNAFNDLIDFFAPVVNIPTDPVELIALMGIDLEDPNWFADIASGIPPLSPPCPDPGTMIPGLGEVGTTRATFACKRGLGWVAGAIYDNAPDDIWGAPGKLVLATLYYPVDYLCLCFEEASAVRFDDLQAAHRDLAEQNLDVDVSTRASQMQLDAANVAVADLDGDVVAAQAALNAIDGEAAALLAGEAEQSEFLADFQELALQLRIESNLLEEGNDRVSMFQLPDTADGFLEVVQVIVENVIQARLDAGRDIGSALEEVFFGDEAYLAGEYKEAYGHYRNAYREATGGESETD
jgi:hypothetical protein